MKVKLGFFYDAWKAIADWVKSESADKPKVEVDGGTIQVSNWPTTQQVAGEIEVTNLPEVQKVEAESPLPVSINGTKSVTSEVLLDAVSVAPLSQTNHINLNITNEKKVVLLVWNDLNTLQIRSSTPWQNVASYNPEYGVLYPKTENFSTTEVYNPHVFVWVGTQWLRLGLTDIKEAFDIALPPVSPSFIQVWNNDPDKTLTITIRILRYWR